MQFSLGMDIVYIPRFKAMTKDAAESVFHSHELRGSQAEHLAGIFAAKEAFFKALGKKIGWLDISVEYKESGRPFLNSSLLDAEQKVVLSISHDGDYAVATVVIFNNI